MNRKQRTRRRILLAEAGTGETPGISPMEHDVAIYVESCKWPNERTIPRDVSPATDREVLWRAPGGVLFYLENYLTGDCCLLALADDLREADALCRIS
jgi:hypothetical protein